MKTSSLFGWIVSVALVAACGGQVLVERGGGDGGNGDGGDGGGAGQPEGGAAACTEVECSNDGGGAFCSCETACEGPDLRAECDLQANGEIVCECHYDGAYMGLCSASVGSVCGLPDGCCYAYLQ